MTEGERLICQRLQEIAGPGYNAIASELASQLGNQQMLAHYSNIIPLRRLR